MALTYLLTDDTGATLSGGDITAITSEKAVTRLLNLPATAKGKVPSHLVGATVGGLPLLSVGRRLKVKLNGTIFFNGMVVNVQDDGTAETDIFTTFTAIDPMWMWGMRPARDADGDFSKPTFIEDFVTGPQIMEEILTNSVSAGGGPPTDAEGDLFLDMGGTIATAGADLSGAPVDWPMTIADVLTLLTSSGELDVVLTPLDTTDGNMATFNAYNGDFGTDLTGSVNFDYFTGDLNVRAITRMQDLSTICNKLWYYLGPKYDDQHWAGNVTGDAPDLPDPPETDIETLRTASQARFGVFMDIRIFDGGNNLRPLYCRLWQTEQKLRSNGRELINITPIRGVAPAFNIGDLIELNAGTKLRGGFTGLAQRVYGFTVGEDDDGVVEVTNIVASPDQEAA